jgi:sterol 3beta-glucosyltransferase
MSAPADPAAFGKKRVLIYTVGSRGDTQPYCALALALAARGHEVAVATEKRLHPLCEELGVPALELGGDSTGVLFEPSAQDALARGSMWDLMGITKEWDKKFDKQQILDSYTHAAATFNPDIIVGAGLTLTQSMCVAELRQVPFLSMILGPTLPTREFPFWPLKPIACCTCLNRWTFNVGFKALWGQESEFIQPWRRRIGLQPLECDEGIAAYLDARAWPVLIACSPLMCGPKREVPADYPAYAHVPGFLFVASTPEEQIDREVREWVELKSDLPLVYLGFGSMPAPDPSRLLRIGLDVCRAANCRAIMLAGWTDLGNAACAALIQEGRASGLMRVFKSAPHDWLLPKCAVNVHHCGVGTVAAALRAGRPQVPCPFMLDQPHNAQLLIDLGCAPCIVPFDEAITGAKLGAAVLSALAPGDEGAAMRRAAVEYAEQVRDEFATASTKFCEIIELHATTKPSY